MSKKKKTNCGDCRYQMSGFDGGFFGLPVTCECAESAACNADRIRPFRKMIRISTTFRKHVLGVYLRLCSLFVECGSGVFRLFMQCIAFMVSQVAI